MDDERAAIVSLICSGLLRLANSFDKDPAKTVTAGATIIDPEEFYRKKHLLFKAWQLQTMRTT